MDPNSSVDAGWQGHPLRRFDLLAAVLLACLAFAARWPFVVNGLTLLHSDECIVGLMAQDIAAGRSLPFYFYGQRYMGSLEAFVVAALLPIVPEHTLALKIGPALFFAWFVAVEYLLLTRWCGRTGGWTGALALIAAAPMWVQWSIAARGAYIEIFVWGTLFWWAYWEWFVAQADPARRSKRLFLLGVLIGSGFWLNPMMLLFVLPALAHWLLRQPALKPAAARLQRAFGGLPIMLPALGLLGLLLLNCLWASWVDNGVQTLLLLGLVSKQAAMLIFALLAVAAIFLVMRNKSLIEGVTKYTPLILGALIGHLPAVAYLFSRKMAGLPVEGSLALGVRPVWTLPTTLDYLVQGLPVLLGANPQPYVDLVQVGRPPATLPLSAAADLLAGLNWVVLVGLVGAMALVVWQQRGEVAALLRLEVRQYSPASFLMLALALLTTLYLINGSSFDFVSIRYLVLTWAILPGLLAAAVTGRFPKAGGIFVAATLLAWFAGQCALYAQLGPPHRLLAVARALEDKGVTTAMAETLDAHVLSYLTKQHTVIGEFRPFWARLSKFTGHFPPDVERAYIVEVDDTNWHADWQGRFPGPAIVETHRLLYPALREHVSKHPESLLRREPLAGPYELWILSAPIDERPLKSAQ